MCSRCPDPRHALVGTLLAVAGLVALSGCEREMRRYDTPPGRIGVTQAPSNTLRAGPSASAPSIGANDTQPSMPPQRFEANAYAIAQGKRLYRWYNCNGCHALGGGDKGPPLADAEWRYGGDLRTIVETLEKGRPNGMPAFGGRVPTDQLWQIAAYVRSLSGELRVDVAPGRSDGLGYADPESRRETAPPVAERLRPETPPPRPLQ